MVLSLFKNKAVEPPLSDVANTHQPQAANLSAVGTADVHNSSTVDKTSNKTNVNLSALHQAPPEASGQPVYKGDPDSEIIVFDVDETILDTGDKRKIDDELATKLGYTVENIDKSAPENKFGRDMKYALRKGVMELFKELYESGHKIVLTTRNYKEYLEAIYEHDPMLKKYVVGTLARPDFEESAINKDFTKYPNHCDNLSLWQKTKSFLAKVFIKTPKFIWHKFKGVFTGKPARWDPGRGTIGKYPPNIIDLLAAKGNHKLDGLKPARFLIDNQASYHAGDPQNSNTYKYHGREYEDSCHSGDFAVISPNVICDNGDKASSFHADREEPRASNGEYLWVKNVKDGIARGWKAQYKLVCGKEPKA